MFEKPDWPAGWWGASYDWVTVRWTGPRVRAAGSAACGAVSVGEGVTLVMYAACTETARSGMDDGLDVTQQARRVQIGDDFLACRLA